MSALCSFGPFQIDSARGVLLRDGQTAAVGQRGIALLLTLVAAQGQAVAKADLMEAGWPGLAVEEGNLTVQIAGLRKLLGPGPQGQDWIVTVPRVGYRLILPQSLPGQEDEAGRPAIAVLPFQNLTGEAEADYFADGIVADIITALSRFRSLAVVSRNSSFVYKGRTVDTREIASALGAGYLLEGSVRRSGDRLRITAQLVEGKTGVTLWTNRYDGILAEVFDFQDSITENVATLVAPAIEATQLAQARRRWTGSAFSYDLFLRARERINDETEAGNAIAHDLLLRALEAEPANAQFLAHASWAIEHRTTMGWPPFGVDDVARCVDFARRGIRLADGDARVMAHCGVSLALTGRDFGGGLSALAGAVAANPNDLFILGSAGIINLLYGDIDLAQDLVQRAIRLSPNDPATRFALIGLAQVELIHGRPASALDVAARSLALNDRFDPTYWVLIAVNGHLGRRDAARDWIRILDGITPGMTVDRIRQTQSVILPERNRALLEGLRLAGMAD